MHLFHRIRRPTAFRSPSRRRLATATNDEDPFILRRRGVLLFAGGFFFGGGGLSGAAVLRWNQDAAQLPEETKEDRRRRKLEARLAAKEAEAEVTCSGLLKRWERWWLPHWALVEAEVRHGFLLLRRAANHCTSSINLAEGSNCTATPLVGARVEVESRNSYAETDPSQGLHDIVLTTAAGHRETLRAATAEQEGRWVRALRGVRASHRRRVIDVDFPSTWEEPVQQPRLVPLQNTSAEYQRVESLAISQQLNAGSNARHGYVKGSIRVTGVSRVQAPHIFEQYAMRRSIIASENDGHPGEHLLWHGTTVPRLIIADGFDPRVCKMDGMFGGGVYFADKSTKSVRYAGASRPGDKGVLLLCRVSLGRPMLKWLPQANMRRPPDPFPLFGWEHLEMWAAGRKFHSVFAEAGMNLLMNEYIVYHTNQVCATTKPGLPDSAGLPPSIPHC